MHTLLRRMGFRYLRRQQRHYLAETPTNVAFRGRYLQSKVINRDANENPQFPEVYLDESYVNQNHVCSRSWLDIGRKRHAKATDFVIIGAGVLQTSGDKTFGAWVEESLHYWQSQLKTKENYHGNFNSELFEMWFHNLCRTLAVNFGTCIIHLDGARNRKRVLNPGPANKWLKVDIQSWLKVRGVPFHAWDLKANLLKKAKAAKEPPQYAFVKIASAYSHRVVYTPPYHPELQPIEIIWANVKNRIGANPAKNMEDLESKLKASLEVVSSNTWEGALRKVQGFEDMYIATADDELLADEEEDEESDGEDDTCIVGEFLGNIES
ncbi:hypothetical protein ACHHYP_11920 [Achlya hypogyna]|uniref:Tc1-like transposase DDE domain-containing protein n=1 Tax=Achlya hypogyna TaxID=1202772 RepID=A0A1V9YI33_ACHHY|nr:hypothetical protein ACHHYP_11920 [Achlya hypogyna]